MDWFISLMVDTCQHLPRSFFCRGSLHGFVLATFNSSFLRIEKNRFTSAFVTKSKGFQDQILKSSENFWEIFIFGWIRQKITGAPDVFVGSRFFSEKNLGSSTPQSAVI